MIYLDNAASGQIHPAVLEKMNQILMEYANPSSTHHLGVLVKREIEKTRELVAREIHCKPNEIYFLPSASVINNLVFPALLKKTKADGVITTATSHASLYQSAHKISGNAPVSFFQSKDFSPIHLDELRRCANYVNPLFALSHVNNETGTINELKGKKDNEFLYVDAVQSFLKIPIDVKKMKIDAMAMSAHKVFSLKGLAMVYIDQKYMIDPLITGGNQEGGLFAGTQNTPAILSLKEVMLSRWDPLVVQEYHDYILDRFSKHPKIRIHSHKNSSPYIIVFSTSKVPSEILLNILSSKGVYLSNGSACHSNKKDESRNYSLLGEEKERVMRLSLSAFLSAEQIKDAIDIIEESIEQIERDMGL